MKSKTWLVIGISGVTCSGKSTLANEIHKKLNGSLILRQDDYFLPTNDPRHTKIPELNHINFEILSSLDMNKMYSDILKIIESFPTKDNIKNTCKTILILDGFLLFAYKPILNLCDLKYFLTLNKEQCWERRQLRTYDPPDVPGYFDKVVWPEYIKHLAEVTKDESKNIKFIDGSRKLDDIVYMVYTEIQKLL